MARDYYADLGIDKSASQEDIKKAFRKLAKIHHPDKHGGDDSEFKKINEAYEVLSDETKKSNYDTFGDPNAHGSRMGGFGADDILNQFRSAWGSRRGGQQPQYKGESIDIIIRLTLEEIRKGVNKELNYDKHIRCNSCSGNGSKNGTNVTNCSLCGGSGQLYIQHIPGLVMTQPCHNCGGSGKKITVMCDDCDGQGLVIQNTKIGISVPAGVYGGWRSTLRGHGHESEMQNSIPGDVHIHIHELGHPLFKREGNNIVYNLKINFPDLILGKTVVIPTLEKNVSFDIPPYSSANSVFQIKGHGLGFLEHPTTFGNLLVKVDLQTPKEISEEEKKMLQEMQKSSNFTVN